MKAALIIIAIALLVVCGTVWFIYYKIKAFARDNFGTDDLKKIAEEQELMEENTPKSVSGMTSLYLPRLQADFPELNWVEFQETARKHLLTHMKEKGYKSPLIHQTVLRDYRKNSGTCYVVLQSSVQYYKEEQKTQSRFNVTMAYVQDAEKTGHETAYSIHCPNCGAPIATLGAKSCEYCGSAVREVSRRVWNLENIEEIG